MNKRISLQDAVSKVKDGMTVMVGGFLGAGSPTSILDELAKSGVKNLTLICNDTAYANVAHGQLITNKQVKKLIVSHIGTNPSTSDQLNSGELDIEFSPQGTLAERIRAAGAGLGGVLTTTGLGTVVEKGKEMITVDGKKYLLEKPLKADIALIGATIADESGNLVYVGTTQNFNPLMATAADIVIVEAEKVLPVGDIAPERVHTPAMFVNYIYSK
jgi:acetate CoA/acetoacetate CoA-transferase alpha subunit